MSNETLSRRVFLASATAPVLSAQGPAKVRIACIGTGHRAAGLIKILRAIPECEIVAIADPTPEFRDRAATIAGPRAKTYSDYKTMLAELKDVDAVLVATPGKIHPEPAIAALGRGLHVLCEKPMAVSIEEANRMIAAADKSGKMLQLDQQFRLRPECVKVKEIVSSGEIGPVKFVSAYLHRGDWNPASWKTPHPKTGVPTVWRYLRSMMCSSIMEDGIHEIDVLNWVISSTVDRVYATGGNAVLKDRETIDHAGLTVEYQNGVKMQFGFTLLGDKVRQDPMLFVCEKGMVRLEDNKVILRKHNAKEQTVLDAAEVDAADMKDNPAMAGQGRANYLSMKSFVDNVRLGRKPAIDGRVGKEALRIPMLAQKSIDERRVVTLKDLPA
jgi:UDP-N-acetylglucosamine 3-dehydrogenase